VMVVVGWACAIPGARRHTIATIGHAPTRALYFLETEDAEHTAARKDNILSI
jgi:hypothetical protein